MGIAESHNQTIERFSTELREPVRLAGTTLDGHCHICAFFHSLDEEYRVLLPFIKEGLERGEKAFHVVDPKLREEHLRH
ncbi:MAG TPA: MEDS domain-containing protein, partial [Methylococcaceae bacterium]|nr:MEDS domain-containing protein [Methylococcaceae bacterium]